MKKQFLIIGLGSFGQSCIETLLDYDVDILLIDKNEETVNLYKDRVANAFVVDVTKFETIERIIPPTIDVAILDLGKNIEVSILLTNYLKKRGIKDIVSKGETYQHGEILQLLGATKVIFPNREAANKIIPLLLAPVLTDYFPIAKELIIAEIKVPENIVGQTLIQADIRKKYQLNLIAFKTERDGEYKDFSPDYRFKINDTILVFGNEKNIYKFLQDSKTPQQKMTFNFFKKIFKTNK